jgi:predicted nucleic acid-binding Zn ribbon protein
MSNPSRRGPRLLSDILGELFTVRGYGRLRARQELEDAWNAAVGEPCCHQTRLGEIRRGVLDVTVAHSTLLEELSAFRKPSLLKALRSIAHAASIHDIRFRVGSVGLEDNPVNTAADRSVSGLAETTKVSGLSARSLSTTPKSRRKPGKKSGADPIQP